MHHKDRNKLNNNIDNLQYLSVQDHAKLHITEYLNSLTSEEKSKIGKRANWGFVNLKNTNPKRYEKAKEKAKNSLIKLYNSEEGKALKKLKSEKGKDWWKENRNSDKVKERNKKISIKAINRNKNHKVIKTEFYGYEDVYNMEVEGTHNFVANNLVVHNCEHHMALFQGEYYFGYIPDKRIVGLSKIARIIDFYASRMQVQERLGYQVVDFLERKLNPKGIILILKASHSCKEIRGVKKQGKMTTSIIRGVFETDHIARKEFLDLINLNK
jgi:GTP cyclohydrolase I